MTPMEAAMVASREANQLPALPGRIGRWWMRWRTHWAALADLVQCSPAELERIARDVGVSAHELHVLAGKWPEAAEPMTRRAAALGLDVREIGRKDPLVMRDLQRVCSLCDSKPRCERDLARDPNDPGWQDYCQNAVSLGAPESKQPKTPVGKGN
jgi:hypothetical protein